MESVLYIKARQAQLCYDDLMEKTGLYPESKVVFRVDDGEEQLLKKACFAATVKALEMFDNGAKQ